SPSTPASASVRWSCSGATAARCMPDVSRGRTRCDEPSGLEEGVSRADRGGVSMRSLARTLLLAGCLVAALVPTPAAADPDGFNEANLRFNQWFLEHVMEPVSRGWN